MMMTQDWFMCGLCGALSVLFMAGCETPQGQLQKRIQHESAFFETLPEEAQERILNGQLNIGDPSTAAWIVYGQPTHTYDRTTEASTNMVWSYCTVDAQPVDQFQSVHYPVLGRRGTTYWTTDYQLQRSYLYDRNEYLRIEFSGDKVLAIDIIKQKK
ncbi:MAG: hypothetical protein FWG50_02390 [Kiritimatiellaeota bacterium]|nr:hypothetical protein [Kiritimatiellota bacterium]